MVRIYGAVNSAEDIRRINAKIRGEVRKARSRAGLTELYNRSKYLVTLTYSPAWRKHFRGRKSPRKTAKEEFSKTARLINRVLKKKGILGGTYDTRWGKGR